MIILTCRKSIQQEFNSRYDNSQNSGYKGDVYQHNKIYDKTTANTLGES